MKEQRKIILSDFGSVLGKTAAPISFRSREGMDALTDDLCGRCGVDRKRVMRLWERMGSERPLLLDPSLTEKDILLLYWDDIRRAGLSLDDIAQSIHRLSSPWQRNESLYDYLKSLHAARACLTGVLSNYWWYSTPLMRDFLDADHSFDFFFQSADIGMAKPHPMIYHYAQWVLGAEGWDILFLDDRPENLIIPNKLGWRTMLVSMDKTPFLDIKRTIRDFMEDDG